MDNQVHKFHLPFKTQLLHMIHNMLYYQHNDGRQASKVYKSSLLCWI